MLEIICSAMSSLCLPHAATGTWTVDLHGGADFTSIQAAVASPLVQNGDTVLVRAGHYLETVEVVGKSINLAAQGHVILDANSTGTPLRLSGTPNGMRVEGFTICNGAPNGGVLIDEGSEPELLDCVIKDNESLFNSAGGLTVNASSALIHNCLVQNNSANVYGAGIVCVNGSLEIAQSTFRGNVTTYSSEIMLWGASSISVTSSILAGPSMPPIAHNAGLQVASVEFSLCPSGSAEYWWDSTCIDADPMFADTGNGPAALSATLSGGLFDSPAIDAGSLAVLAFGSTSIDGRPDCGRVDIGFHSPFDSTRFDINSNGIGDPCETIGTAFCSPATINSTGAPGVVALFGSEVVFFNQLQLGASQLPGGSFGYFICSLSQGPPTTPPFGSQGSLCLSGNIGRGVGGGVLNSGSDGFFFGNVNLNAVPQPSGTVAVAPGDTWHFQAWYRDANPTVSSNFTDAVAVTFQ